MIRLHLIYSLRGLILFLALVAAPGIAICWNWIPSVPFHHYDQAQNQSPTAAEEFDSVDSESAPPEDTQSAQAFPAVPTVFQPEEQGLPQSAVVVEPRQTMLSAMIDPFAARTPQPINGQPEGQSNSSPTYSRTALRNQVAATALAEFANNNAPTGLEPVRQTTNQEQETFQSLARELQALGANRYKLEKWGSRGELFRFSCCVNISQPYRGEKQFQCIGNDEIQVMQSVLIDIKNWKNSSTNPYLNHADFGEQK
jgi:hypothetical protein